MAAWFSWRESLVDYRHLQEIKEARPKKSKIVSEQWTTGRGKRQPLFFFFFSFPFPYSPAGFFCFLSPQPPYGKKRLLRGWRRDAPQSKINTGHSETSLRFAEVREKIALFSHIHGWTKTSLKPVLPRNLGGRITWSIEKSWQSTLEAVVPSFH